MVFIVQSLESLREYIKNILKIKKGETNRQKFKNSITMHSTMI